MKHQRFLLRKLIAILLVLLILGPFVNPLWADTVVGDADNYTIQVDTDDNGTGVFTVTDGTATPVNVIVADGGSTTISSTAFTVDGTTSLGSTLGVTGNTTLTGSLTANGGISADGFTVEDTTGNVATSGTLGVTGATTLSSTLGVTGATTLSSTLGVSGNTTLSTVSTSGLATLDSANVTNNATVGGTMGITGNLTAQGATNIIGTAGSSANTLTGATNTITGATTVTSIGTANQMIVDATSSRFVSADGTKSVAVGNSGTTITGAAGHTLNVTSATTTVNGTATVYSGNGAGNQMVVDATSSRFVSADTFSNTTVSDGAVSLVADSDALSTNARSGLSMAPTSASLLVNTDSGESHGVSISQTSTVISGGTDSTTLTLDDDGAKFADEDTGAPVKVTGVANGVGDYDAVNMRQYRRLDSRIDKAYSGIASVAALAAIPAPVPGKNLSVGLGFGNFENQNALALGGKALIGKKRDITLTAGVGYCDNTATISAGVGWSF